MSRKSRKGIGRRLGRCYELSGHHVLYHHDWVLVHGRISVAALHAEEGDDRPPLRNGIDFPISHAWCEKGELVYDPVLDETYPRAQHYARLAAGACATYTHEEMCEKLRVGQVWQPWDSCPHEPNDPCSRSR